MTNFVVTTNQSVTQDVETNDTLYLASGIRIATSSGDGIETPTFTENTIRIMIEGSVLGAASGIDLESSTTGTSTGFGNSTVQIGQDATVTGMSGPGLHMMGQNNSLINYGTLASLATSGLTAGLWQNGDGASIQNHGNIGGNFGILLLGDGDSSDIVNTGTISGRTAAIRASGQSLNLVNSGTISVAVGEGGGDAIDILNSSSSPNYITNTGTIIGDISGALDQSLDLINTGTISGAVTMSFQNDLYDGRGGTLLGSVDGGGGNDTYIVDDATLDLREGVGGGTDTVQSTVSYKLLDFFENLGLLGADDLNGTGNGLDHVINGNSGDNKLAGGAGDDELTGNQGDDVLRGQQGKDDLSGGRGDDKLLGNGGADRLDGGDGNDILIGGAGKDRLTGGADNDVFRFVNAAFTPNSSGADTIRDFSQGEDLIDLSRMSADTFDFLGSGGFTSSGQAEVRIVSVSGGNSHVRIYVDGDGSADARIIINNLNTLAESDFLL